MDAQLSKPRRDPKWNPATLEEVTLIAITEKFFNTVLEGPIPAPVTVDGEAVSRDSPAWAEYTAGRKADQLDLLLAGGGSGVGGVRGGGGSGGGKDIGSGRKKVGGVGTVGGFEEPHQQYQQYQPHQHQGEDRKTNYGLPTEEEIRAVLVRAKTGSSDNMRMGVVGMTRKQLEMALKGDRPAIKLGVRERLDEVIARKELSVEGRDWLVWRDELRDE